MCSVPTLFLQLTILYRAYACFHFFPSKRSKEHYQLYYAHDYSLTLICHTLQFAENPARQNVSSVNHQAFPVDNPTTLDSLFNY